MAGSANITERGADGVAFEKPIPASQPGDTFPAGAVMMYAGAAAPTGWIICDGSAVSRATYPTLFTNIGTTWGAGNGSTTFNLPDFRDRVPVGKSGTKALASSAGGETHNITIAELPSHNHGGATGNESALHIHQVAISYVSSSLAGGPGFGVLVASGGSGGTQIFATDADSVDHTHGIPAQGSGTAISVMQPYSAINYIIRAY